MRARRPPTSSSVEPAIRAGVAISLALGELSCARSAPQEAGAPTATVVLSAPPSPSAEAPPEPAPAATVIEKLRPYVVTNAHFARRTLFTWTTREQVDELSRDRVLLTRTESPVHGPAHSDQVLSERAAAGDRLAALLRTSAFARARHAWPAPFATLQGWPGETYGEELIRIDLKLDAWTAKLQTSNRTWEIVDLDNRPVPLEEVLKNPARLAVVYFVEDMPLPKRRGGTFMGPEIGRPAYRDYVICNESMIERWAIGTDEIARELAAEADAIDALRKHLAVRKLDAEPLDAWNVRVARSVWPAGPDTGVAPRVFYESALAFPNELYQPEIGKLAALAEHLRAVAPRGAAVEHRPTAVFAAPSASAPVLRPRAPVPPPIRRRGTY